MRKGIAGKIIESDKKKKEFTSLKGAITNSKMAAKDTVPVSLVLLDKQRNLSFTGTLVLAGANATSQVDPTEAPYDGKGAGLFTVVVITVYGISIVLFIASFIKRKKGIIIEAEESNTVNNYLTQVPDLKEKTAREHFKKLKMGIMEKVERGSESDREDISKMREGRRSSFSKSKDRKIKSGTRQPLIGKDDCLSTQGCTGGGRDSIGSMSTCAKLVQALHSISEAEEKEKTSHSDPSSGSSYSPRSCDPFLSSYGTSVGDPLGSVPTTPGIYPGRFQYSREISAVSSGGDSRWSYSTGEPGLAEIWENPQAEFEIPSPPPPQIQEIPEEVPKAPKPGRRSDEVRISIAELSPPPLVPNTLQVPQNLIPALPPPPQFQQGYRQQLFVPIQEHKETSGNTSDEFEHPQDYSYDDEFEAYFAENPTAQIRPKPVRPTPQRCQIEISARPRDPPSPRLIHSSADPKKHKQKQWPHSPSLNQAAMTRLTSKRHNTSEEDWDREDSLGPNGLSLRVLGPWEPKGPSIGTPPSQISMCTDSKKSKVAGSNISSL